VPRNLELISRILLNTPENVATKNIKRHSSRFYAVK